MKYILLLMAVFIVTVSSAQSKPNYDTVNFVRCQLTKIERDMRVGNWLTIERDNGEIRYAIMHYIDRRTKEMIGECVLLGKDQWFALPKTKR